MIPHLFWTMGLKRIISSKKSFLAWFQKNILTFAKLFILTIYAKIHNMSLGFVSLDELCENAKWEKWAIFSSFFEFQQYARKMTEWWFWQDFTEIDSSCKLPLAGLWKFSKSDFKSSKNFDMCRWYMNFFHIIIRRKCRWKIFFWKWSKNAYFVEIYKIFWPKMAIFSPKK